MTTNSDALLVPRSSDETQPYWDGAQRGELLVQACSACGRLRFPPRVMCPWCQSTAREWRPVSGEGTIWSFVVPHPPLLPGYAELSPYNVITVALAEDEQIRLVGNLVASAEGPINEIDPTTITIGESVRVVFSPLVNDVVVPRWVRA